MVLSAPGARDRLDFLNASPKCNSVQELVSASEQPTLWLQPGGPIEVSGIEDDLLGNLFLARAAMTNAFLLQWPRQPIEQIMQIHKQRFAGHGVELSDNVNGPCFYY